MRGGAPGRLLSPRRARPAGGRRGRGSGRLWGRPAARRPRPHPQSAAAGAKTQVSARPWPGPRAAGTGQREVALFSSLSLWRGHSFDISASAAQRRG